MTVTIKRYQIHSALALIVILKKYQVINSETKGKKQNQLCQYINWLISISVSLCPGYWMLSVSLCTESTLSVYKLTDINFSQFMYWLLNEYPSVYLLAIKWISVSLCTGYYTNWLWHIHRKLRHFLGNSTSKIFDRNLCKKLNYNYYCMPIKIKP